MSDDPTFAGRVIQMLDRTTSQLTELADSMHEARMEKVVGRATVTAPRHAAYDLNDCHKMFRRWLGDDYDGGSLDAVLAVAASDRLGGDPPWLLLISGSGNAKTETVGSLASIGAIVVSTITSEGALLSATPERDKAKGASGGLLRKLEPGGLLVVKDFTSIISMDRNVRASVLAALREVHDGYWSRNVGVDGGKTLTWKGRVVLIGATTSAYDAAHSVIAAMGDRFALVRVDSTIGRASAGRMALRNVDQETIMRADLAGAVKSLIGGIDPAKAQISDDDTNLLVDIADLVTYARTAVERDYQGNVIDAHSPEMPTRFTKMLGQILRGGLAIGMTHHRALGTAIRVAGDSMPPLRLAILGSILNNPGSRTGDVEKDLQKPRTTVDRELQALHLLGLLHKDQGSGTGWNYQLSERVETDILRTLITRKVSEGIYGYQEEPPFSRTPTHKSGDEAGLS